MNNTKTVKTIMLITGIITAIFGVCMAFTPLRTFLSIGWILGILLLLNGIELVIISLSKRKKQVSGCILGVLEGIAGIILLCSAFQRFLTDMTAVYLIGGSILVYGIFQIVNSFNKYKESKTKGILGIVCGILSILIGIVSFAHPVLTMISVGYIIAFSILMQGINMILLSMNLENTK